jgi:3'-5' exoribonuclease
VKELSVGERVEEFYLVRSKRNLTTRNGKPYMDLDLADATGQVNAKVWDKAAQLSDLFQRGDVIKVRGMVEDYMGAIQLKVQQLRPLNDDDKVDMAELVKSSRFDQAEMLAYFEELVASMEDDNLRMLMEAFFGDEEFVSAFSRSAAARNIHHSYVGGLMEHTMKVTKVSVFCADELYPGQVRRDLIIAGAVLHDIGKIRELSLGADAG